MFRLGDTVKVVKGSNAFIGMEGVVSFIYGDNEGFLVTLSDGRMKSFFLSELEVIEKPEEVQRIADAIYEQRRTDDPMTWEDAYTFALGLYKAGVRHNG